MARINLLLTFLDYYEDRWERRPDDKLLEQTVKTWEKQIQRAERK